MHLRIDDEHHWLLLSAVGPSRRCGGDLCPGRREAPGSSRLARYSPGDESRASGAARLAVSAAPPTAATHQPATRARQAAAHAGTEEDRRVHPRPGRRRCARRALAAWHARGSPSAQHPARQAARPKPSSRRRRVRDRAPSPACRAPAPGDRSLSISERRIPNRSGEPEPTGSRARGPPPEPSRGDARDPGAVEAELPVPRSG